MWIRSQDKEILRECEDLRLFQETLNVYKYSLTAQTRGDFDIMGKYKSKKRCLEVLDEIQKRINTRIKYKINTQIGITDFTEADMVYQMPKE